MASKKLSDAPSEPSGPKKDGGPDDYEASNAMDTIAKAHEHMQDPDMMKRVAKHVGRKVKSLQGIKTLQDVRDAYHKKYGTQRRTKQQINDDDGDAM